MKDMDVSGNPRENTIYSPGPTRDAWEKLAVISVIAQKYGFVREKSIKEVLPDVGVASPALAHAMIDLFLSETEYNLVEESDDWWAERVVLSDREYDLVDLEIARIKEIFFGISHRGSFPLADMVYRSKAEGGKYGGTIKLIRKMSLAISVVILTLLRDFDFYDDFEKFFINSQSGSNQLYAVQRTDKFLPETPVEVAHARTVRFILLAVKRHARARKPTTRLLAAVMKMKVNLSGLMLFKKHLEDTAGFVFDCRLMKIFSRVMLIRDSIFERNIRLVYHFAKNEDEFQAASIGMIRAIDLFDCEAPTSFSTYATWWIKQGAARERDASCLVRLPAHFPSSEKNKMKNACVNIDCCPDLLTQSNTESIDLDLDRLLLLRATISGQLSQREKFVLIERFGLRDGVLRTLEDLGNELSVTRERVRQIQASAISKLKKVLL